MHLKIGRRSSRSILLASATATHNADQPAVLKQLLSVGNSVHESDGDGNTCLHLILFAALPEQPWTVQSLICLIQAGADPTRTNHSGVNAFDIACQPPPAYGSFRRDILLQALLEADADLPDDRLLMPTELTASYTRLHHTLICGDPHARADFHFRQALVNRLAFETHRPSIGPRSELYDSSVDRILSSSPQWHSVNPDVAFHQAQLYLQSIISARKQLKDMIEGRISYEIWTAISRFIDMRQAQNAALLEFDWFLPVDLEDVFVSQIDCLIQRLEDLVDLHPTSVHHLDDLIWALENAIPKPEQRRSSRDLVGSSLTRPRLTQQPQIVVTASEEGMSLSDQEESEPSSPRKESMVKTPVQFYVVPQVARAAKLPQLSIACIDNTKNEDETSESPRKESMVKTPIHFYLCQLRTGDALPFAQSQL